MSDQIELQKIVGQVAAAYFNGNHVTPSEIPMVIANITASIRAVGAPAAEEAAEAVEASKLTPVQIRKSVTHDAIISFEDNRRYKMLRRHLASRGMSPDEYRRKWGLPSDYPMVAPGYSETRSNLAKERGLGGRKPVSAPAAVAAPSE
ncbi:MAG TPA: MucR family transcriptional regulator, partial [Allosphingosinicella sp.]|nr:MucR family transcriptional regulator [Allosphingosinicella sp.]